MVVYTPCEDFLYSSCEDILIIDMSAGCALYMPLLSLNKTDNFLLLHLMPFSHDLNSLIQRAITTSSGKLFHIPTVVSKAVQFSVSLEVLSV